MRCVSYMRRDSYWRDERNDYHHKPTPYKKSDYGYFDLDGDLIAQQREHIREYADRLGWVVEEEYIDIEGLDEFERLKKDCIARKFDRVITDSFYRFSGDIAEARVTLEHVFLPVGIQIAVAQDQFCSELSTKKGIEYYFRTRQISYSREGYWLDKRKEDEGSKTSKPERKTRGETKAVFSGKTILGSRIHDGETGEQLHYSGCRGTGILHRECDVNLIKWEIPCPVVPYDAVLSVLIRTLQQEKAAAEWARENIFSDDAGKKKEELLTPLKTRVKELVKETDSLLARRMEIKKNEDMLILSSRDTAGGYEHVAEEHVDNKILARVDEELSSVMEKINRIETAYSLSNRWMKLFDGIDIPENLNNRLIKLYFDDIRVYGMERGEVYSVQVIVRYEEFRSLLPAEWLSDLIFDIPDPEHSGLDASDCEMYEDNEQRTGRQEGGE